MQKYGPLELDLGNCRVTLSGILQFCWCSVVERLCVLVVEQYGFAPRLPGAEVLTGPSASSSSSEG